MYKPYRGYIHVYMGNGKGKTTAALGLALRAVGAGMKVFIAQFVKGMPYSELDVIRDYLPGIEIRQYGRGCFIVHEPSPEDVEAARAGFYQVSEIVMSGTYDLVILDEIFIALYYHLIVLDDVLDLLDRKPIRLEVVLTGRYAPLEIIDKADLVTDMAEIKHYFAKGVEARKGIEF